jgi:hypothetical protein
LRNDEWGLIDENATVDRTTSWPYPIADPTGRRVDSQRFNNADVMMFDMHLLNGCLACRSAEEGHAENDA